VIERRRTDAISSEMVHWGVVQTDEDKAAGIRAMSGGDRERSRRKHDVA